MIGLRQMRANPGFTLLVTLVLGLGISLVITLASVLDAVYFKPVPYPDSKRLIHLEVDNVTLGYRGLGVTAADFLFWRENNPVFEDLAAYRPPRTMILATGGPEPLALSGVGVSPHLPDLLRVEPRHGQPLSAANPAEPAILLSHRVWIEVLDGDTGRIGDQLRLNGRPVRLLGVMPPGFAFPAAADLWIGQPIRPGEEAPTRWGTLQVVGRLSDGVSLSAAREAFDLLGRELESQRPAFNAGIRPVLKAFHQEYTEGPLQRTAFMLFFAVLLVLGIACANVANLMVARSAGEVRSFAIRLAAGARRWQLAAQVLVNSLLLAVLGTLAGYCISLWGIDLAARAFNQSGSVPFWLAFELDGRVLAFTGGLTIATALAAGILPAWRLSGLRTGPLLKENAPTVAAAGLGRISRSLVVLQIALAFTLILGAVLMVQSFLHMRDREARFVNQPVLTAPLPLEDIGLPSQAARLRLLFGLLDRLDREPAVDRAALTTHLPGTGSAFTYFSVEGRNYPDPDRFPFCRAAWVSPDFFAVFGTEPLAGRTFRTDDRAIGEPLAVVNDSLARQLQADGIDPVVGHRIRAHSGEPGWEATPWIRIIGIVPDLGMQGLGNLDSPAGLYLNYSQGASGRLHLLLRPAGQPPSDPDALARSVERVITGLESALPVPALQPLTDILDEQLALSRLLGQVFTVFGFVATLLASLGLYTVVRHAVEARRHEIGIRMALGASPGTIRNQVFRLVGVQISIGLSLGILLALGLGLVLHRVVAGISPTEPLAFLAVALFITAVGLLAGWQPARQAARTDPVNALRVH